MLVMPTTKAPRDLQYLRAFRVSAVSPVRGSEEEGRVGRSEGEGENGREVEGQGQEQGLFDTHIGALMSSPDWLMKNTTSSLKMGVDLSRKSDANSTTTGSSVSSSKS